MHLRLSCSKCGPGLSGHPVTVEIEDRGVYRLVCDSGHETVHHLNNPKFEILIEMGLLAFSDGYTREAVATFAAAVEEFFRVFVTMVLFRHKFNQNPKWDELTPFWKVVSRAEPQLGAFAALYMIEKGCAPPYPDKKSVEFRNEVIHRGRIPKAADVAEYGQKMLSFLVPLYVEYRQSTEMMLASSYNLLQEIVSNPQPLNASTYYVSAFRHLMDLSGEPSFEAAVGFARTDSFLRTPAT